MHANVLHMLLIIALFAAANLLFMWKLSCYRKQGKSPFATLSPPLENRLLKDNFTKLSFMFAVACFAVFITSMHTGISCDEIKQPGQCECYALEAMQRTGKQQKIHWAANGQRMCPDSTFFTSFLEKKSK